MAEANWTVGKVAQRCGVKVSTLHFCEQKVIARIAIGECYRVKPDLSEGEVSSLVGKDMGALLMGLR